MNLLQINYMIKKILVFLANTLGYNEHFDSIEDIANNPLVAIEFAEKISQSILS